MTYPNANFNNFKAQNQSPVSNNYPEKANWGIIYGNCGTSFFNLDDAIREISSGSPLTHQKIKEKCLRDGHYSYGDGCAYCCIHFEGHLEEEEEEYTEEEDLSIFYAEQIAAYEAQAGDFDND